MASAAVAPNDDELIQSDTEAGTEEAEEAQNQNKTSGDGDKKGPLLGRIAHAVSSLVRCIDEGTTNCFETLKTQKLDTTRIVQRPDTLVLVSHGVTAKVFGALMWICLALWFLTVFYGAVAYSLGHKMEWSPRYMEQKQYEALAEIDKILQAEDHLGLMLNHTRSIPAPVAGIGDL